MSVQANSRFIGRGNGSGIPAELLKLALSNIAPPIASALGQRIGQMISPRKGSGYRLAGAAYRYSMKRKTSQHRRSSSPRYVGGRRKSSSRKRRSRSRSTSVVIYGGRRRKSSRSKKYSGGRRRKSSRSRKHSGGRRRRSSRSRKYSGGRRYSKKKSSTRYITPIFRAY